VTASGGAATRADAARAVAAVLFDGRNLNQALADTCAGEAEPAAQVQALAYGCLRWHCRYQQMLDHLLTKPLRSRDRQIYALLSVGLFQLFEGREPAYAAVSATVEAARVLGRPRLSGLVNGVLRRAQRESDALQALAMRTPAGRYAHPDWLIDSLRNDWPDDADRMLEANQQQPPMWLRANRLRKSRDEVHRLLTEAGIHCDRFDGFPDALRLARPMSVDRLPGFSEGWISVQDAAAQLVAPLLDASPGMRVLDACAAPGGKTTHLQETAGGELEVVALDSDQARLARVADNLTRLGVTAELLHGDASRPEGWWDGRRFERILVDAPCSATGVIRRHPDIRFLRRPDDIEALVRRQRAILDALWPLLAESGRLVYATCSVLRAENQAVMQAFLDAHADAQPVPVRLPGAQIARRADRPGLQLLPGDADTDGFYYAVAEKTRARRA
jgi:16S rRNA (cytosine967-C5)-methyltransferase